MAKRERCHAGKATRVVGWLALLSLLFLALMAYVFVTGRMHIDTWDVSQRAQFNSINAAIELFVNECGGYPPSDANDAMGRPYCGSMKLAEALMGRDLLGFHSESGFRADGLDPDTLVPLYPAAPADENLKARMGPFLPPDHVGAYRLADIYGKGKTGPFPEDIVVLCDTYEHKRPGGKKTGMPILYWRARTAYKFQDYLENGTGSATNPGQNDDIYNFWHNANLLNLRDPATGTIDHPLYTGVPIDDLETFEEIILNKQVQEATMTALNPTGIKRPYRDDSFILMSAGKDELFGTADDLYNFTKESQ